MASGKSFLLFIIASLVSAAITEAQTPSPDPLANLTYKCDGNGSYWINFSALNDKDTFIITDGNVPKGPMYDLNDTSCTTQLLNTTNSPTVNLTKCENNPIVYMMINRSGSLEKLIGGRSFQEYELECKLPGGGINISVNKEFGVTPQTPVTKVERPIVNLIMKFKHENSTSDSKFKLNEKVILDIHDNSAVPHGLKLLTCDARPDQNNEVQTNLYDVSNNNTVNDIFENVTTGERDINVKLRAFRFVSSSKTYIQCTVRVCNANDTACNKTRRRRADAVDLDTVRTVDGSFSILQPDKAKTPVSSGQPDKPKTPVSSGQPTVTPWCASIISAIALVVSTYMTK